MAQLKLILVTALIAMVLIFTFQNMEVVTVNFLQWEVSVSRALLLISLFLVGLLLGWLLPGTRRK
ncbi:MAG: lipopolysaccharide assembly protein LapA domain-containing protein [Gammaproteobacteria bacterium]|nr:lipopolysaccharide assembly protein LapA domain-containing protein [Gammaproteobacteria bacterium]